MATRVSQLASYTTTSSALPNFKSPLELLWLDIKLIIKNLRYAPTTILPLTPCLSGPLDELSFTAANLYDITFHAIIVFLQLGFLASLPLCFVLPLGTFLVYFIGFIAMNYIIFMPFNGPRDRLFVKRPNTGVPISGTGEKWIFINGVSVGRHWLDSNLQRLANTFRREICAVHNPTSGIIFDLIQCLIERDFDYNTLDIRQAYELVKKELTDSKNDTVVLILHSQGAIEGGMVIDWLLADIPEAAMSKLEVYTFGNAANHFNNPVRRSAQEGIPCVNSAGESKEYYRAIRHIEHYANSGDFVSRFGVLHFSKRDSEEKENRFVGQVLERQGNGHMLCQHYLDTMFVMKGNKVAESNPFMDSRIVVDKASSFPQYSKEHEGQTVKSISRLWQYKNGETPAF